jgi:hypothetical protein
VNSDNYKGPPGNKTKRSSQGSMPNKKVVETEFSPL